MRTVAYWDGRPIEELSRDELLAALVEVGRELDHTREMLSAGCSWGLLRRARSPVQGGDAPPATLVAPAPGAGLEGS